MYVHPAFGIGAAAAVAILRERAFGLLVVPAADAPFGVHVPFLVDEMPDGGLRVTLHVARANPIHGHVGSGSDHQLDHHQQRCLDRVGAVARRRLFRRRRGRKRPPAP